MADVVGVANKLEFLSDCILYDGDQIAIVLNSDTKEVELGLTDEDLDNGEVPSAKRKEILDNADEIVQQIVACGYTIVSEDEDEEEGTQFALDELIGMKKVDAIDEIKEAGWRCRITKRDGKSLIGTRDYRTDRINLEIEDDTVVKAHVG